MAKLTIIGAGSTVFTKKIVTDTLQLDMSSSIAEAIESEEKSLLVQRKEEVNEPRLTVELEEQ